MRSSYNRLEINIYKQLSKQNRKGNIKKEADRTFDVRRRSRCKRNYKQKEPYPFMRGGYFCIRSSSFVFLKDFGYICNFAYKRKWQIGLLLRSIKDPEKHQQASGTDGATSESQIASALSIEKVQLASIFRFR